MVPRAALEKAAIARVVALSKEKRRRAEENFVKTELAELKRITNSKELAELFLGGNSLGRMVVFRKGREMVQSKTRGNYPAPFAALKAVEAGLAKGMSHGFLVESEEFGKLLVSDVSRRLVEIFYATQELKKDPGVLDRTIKPRAISSLGVLGGGLMGSGIAFVAANQGIRVRMKEKDPESGAKALNSIWSLLNTRVKRKALAARDAERRLSRISVSTDFSGFRRAEMVIEAVFEDLELKKLLLQELEKVTDERCIFASNTSSLPISKIAQASQRPEMVLGMHFFSPVHKMPLLEIIVTNKTADLATATVVDLGKRLGKQVIVVKDGVGFYTTRILAPYLNEAAHLLAEGGAVDAIDKTMIDFGFPVGPFTLMDEIGIDVGEKVAKIMFEAFGERMKPVEALAGVIADNRLGRKNQRGYYTYDDKKKKAVDETVYDLLPERRKRRPQKREEVQQRIVLQMVNEALHCLGEGVLRSPRDGDMGAIFGLGFPPFLGGPFRYVDIRGAQEVVQELERFREQHGVRFDPAPALLEAAKTNRSFRD